MDLFANRLKEAMEDNNINITKLSNLSKISKPLLSNYLSGNYKAKQNNVYKLAEVLNVSPSWLMGLDVNEERSNLEQITKIFKDKGVINNEETLTMEEVEELFELMRRNKDLVIKKKGE